MRLTTMKRVHFVGVGGVGMSGIAEVLCTMGFTVSGSDLVESAVTKRLEALGVTILTGHRAENVRGAQVLVFSSAVSRDNLELEEARRLGVPVIPRAEMLGELMRLKTSVAVAGTHGKTTVTAMIAHLAYSAGLDPTVVIGGRLSRQDSSARLGKGDLLIAEADESDRSFLLLYPNLALITNIDWDHVDCYRDLEDLKEAFLSFANKVPFYGVCVVCADDPNVRALLPRFRRRVVTYGTAPPADFLAVPKAHHRGEQGEVFGLVVRGEKRGEIVLGQTGRHGVLNALAALATGGEMAIGIDVMREALASFPGVDRRFEKKGEAGGIRVVDDYGHHPTEIRATLEAARRVAEGGRIIVLFQPHRYTRVAALADAFAEELSKADVVVVSEIYPAGEAPIPGVSGKILADKIGALGGGVRYCPRVEEMASFVHPALEKGDLVLTLGAGTVTRVGPELLHLLEDSHGH